MTTEAQAPVTVEQNYTPDLVIYHGHCADGFAAAWACWMRWRDQCRYVPANYGEEPPQVDGLNVLIVDFSYKRDVLRSMGQKARSVIVLDHHKTAAAELADWTIDDVAGDFWAGDDPMKSVRHNDDHIGQPIAAIFDMGKSGARLAWEFCHDADAPRLIELVEDRDLWRFQYEDTKPFSLWLRSEPFDFYRFELLDQQLNDARDCDRIMNEAQAMQRFFDAKVEEIASFAHVRAMAEHSPIVVNCPPMFASEVGHALLDKHPAAPFAAMFYDSHNKRMWSLRSRDDRQDVSEIAALWGGGGHRNAAGFSEALASQDVAAAVAATIEMCAKVADAVETQQEADHGAANTGGAQAAADAILALVQREGGK
ncbi:hypothetical protein [Sphingomonas japonica]|uniref:Oligoribonuclease NrnB/cAMP/cGMP phosphodiesterase (DHH superfamily) n=1 Tax=Sphingomonas japonica TaxID=511662 RepID=A0ABX0U5X6_9SPHN|nr:hypothetical protein [Sphingomonas japonica]NIJ24791.1 oligoribonuclease NrnB/cAMP/cGMP phosphodiesterase (DHH superfamily) [Sphingomonas japonica]